MAKFYTVAYRQQAEKVFGGRQSTEVAKRAAAAARRQLLILPLQNHHAFPHIGAHFAEQPEKDVNGIFFVEYQKPAELTRLLLCAIDNPGTEPMLSKSDDGDWAVVLQTWFGLLNPIGYDESHGSRQNLHYLRLVVDLNGDLITAYPTNGYLQPGDRAKGIHVP